MALTTIPSELSSVSGITDSSDATAITIDSSENVTFAGNILKTGDFTLDVSGDIYLDADNGAFYFRDGGTTHGYISTGNNNFGMTSSISDDDIVFTGNDGGSMITALRLDMSAAGAATFNKGVTFGDDLTMPTNSNITWGADYSAIGSLKNSQALLLGNNVKAGATNNTAIRHANGTDAGNYIKIAYNKGVTFHTNITETQNSEFNENLNERMRINTSGYVGIGETSPDNIFHVTGNSWNTAHLRIERTDVGGSNDAGLVFKSAAGAATDTGLGGVWFQNALDGNAYALIRARTDDSSGTSGRLEFITSASAVGNATSPAMTIKSDGKIGIGGSSPQQALHIFGDSGDARMQFTNSTSGNADADGLWVGMDNSQAYILQRENQPVSIYTNATKSWEFHEAGHLICELAGKYLQLTGSSSHAYAIGVDDNSVTPGTASTSFSISRWNGTDWKNPFRINTAGTVQIRGLSTSSEPQVSAGEVLAVDGPQSYGYESRYVQGIWGPKQCSNAQQYVHLVTDLWGGGSPHGNSEYIMGGFIITGYRYASNANLHDMIQFHNWSGTMYNITKDELGSWTGATHAYVNSSGWVTLRLYLGGANSYRCFTVDFVQYGNLYSKRTAKVTAETSSASATI